MDWASNDKDGNITGKKRKVDQMTKEPPPKPQEDKDEPPKKKRKRAQEPPKVKDRLLPKKLDEQIIRSMLPGYKFEKGVINRMGVIISAYLLAICRDASRSGKMLNHGALWVSEKRVMGKV